jgi:Coenzyme PQQ synthesis protein D (PqqD)
MLQQQTRIRAVHSAEGAVLMDIDRGKLFSLNGTGSAVYELLSQGLEDQAIVEELTRRFYIPRETAVQDLRGFQEALRLLEVAPMHDAPSRSRS